MYQIGPDRQYNFVPSLPDQSAQGWEYRGRSLKNARSGPFFAFVNAIRQIFKPDSQRLTTENNAQKFCGVSDRG
jgi:hypothetical protein